MSRIYNPPTVTKGKVTSSSASQTAASRTTSPNVVIMRGTSVTVTPGSNGSNGLTRQYSADPLRLIKADTNPLSVRAQQTLTMLESQNEWKTERRKAVAMGSYRDPADNDWQQVYIYIYVYAMHWRVMAVSFHLHMGIVIFRPHSTRRCVELLRILINSLQLNKYCKFSPGGGATLRNTPRVTCE
jgi:hypothetical protein